MSVDFVRYLAAKRSVDDRALNQQVVDRLRAELSVHRVPGSLEVLEIGAGIGTMIERAADWRLFAHCAGSVKYLAIDADAANISAAAHRLANPTKSITSQGLQVVLKTADLFDLFETTEYADHFDLLIANAFLDLVDVGFVLPRLRQLLRPGGLGWFTLNFDGATILQPEIDTPFDTLVEMLYHRTMDERLVTGRPSGDSRTGRHLFQQLRSSRFEILAAGASDWVLFAGADGYPHDEAAFLHFIIEMMHGALADCSELDSARYADWIAMRHAQIDNGVLAYVAHQLDFLVRRPL